MVHVIIIMSVAEDVNKPLGMVGSDRVGGWRRENHPGSLLREAMFSQWSGAISHCRVGRRAFVRA